MLNIQILCVGTLKEAYLRDAVREYSKRIGGYAKLTLRETKSDRELIPLLPQRSYKIALCVEGKQLSSEELAAQLERVAESHGELCLIVGSSFGLSEKVKSECHMRLSVSRLTFPHQMMRVLLLETVYRSFNILKGTRYHK